jgi:hypothetical protein
MSTTGIVSL